MTNLFLNLNNFILVSNSYMSFDNFVNSNLASNSCMTPRRNDKWERYDTKHITHKWERCDRKQRTPRKYSNSVRMSVKTPTPRRNDKWEQCHTKHNTHKYSIPCSFSPRAQGFPVRRRIAKKDEEIIQQIGVHIMIQTETASGEVTDGVVVVRTRQASWRGVQMPQVRCVSCHQRG